LLYYSSTFLGIPNILTKKAQTATIILPGLPQLPIIYGEVCAYGATSR